MLKKASFKFMESLDNSFQSWFISRGCVSIISNLIVSYSIYTSDKWRYWLNGASKNSRIVEKKNTMSSYLKSMSCRIFSLKSLSMASPIAPTFLRYPNSPVALVKNPIVINFELTIFCKQQITRKFMRIFITIRWWSTNYLH